MFDCELKFVVFQDYKESYMVNTHKHPCYEIVFYINGEGKTTINNVTYDFMPNTFSIIEPNCNHNETGNANVKLIYIGFDILNDSIKFKSKLYDNANFDILNELLLIKDEMKNQSQYYSRMLNLLTEQIVIKLKRGINEIAKQNNDKIEYIINFIKLNCMKNIKVNLIAKSFGFNYDYFRRMFKEKMGISIKDYIIQEKLNYAIDLLKNSDLSISEIAYRSGFASPSHFGVVFKENMHKNPKDFLREYKMSNSHKEIAFFNDNEDKIK